MKKSTDVNKVFAGGESLVDSGVLPGEPDTSTNIVRIFHDINAVNDGCAGIWPNQGREHFDRCCLARSVRAEEPVHRSRWYCEVNPVECEGVAKSLDDSLHLYCMVFCHQTSMPASSSCLDTTSGGILKSGVLPKPHEFPRSDRPGAMLRNDDFSTGAIVCFRVVDLIAIQKHDDVGILFE